MYVISDPTPAYPLYLSILGTSSGLTVHRETPVVEGTVVRTDKFLLEF